MFCDTSTLKSEGIHLSTITPDNWRIFNGLKVKDNQLAFVPSNVVILARAFAYREHNSHDSVILCYIDGNERARDFYLRMGFKHTGVIDEDEVVMEYDLKDRNTPSDNQ